MPVKPTCEPNKVRLTGPGVSSKGVPASLPTEFTVDAREAGFGDLEAQILVRDWGDGDSVTGDSTRMMPNVKTLHIIGTGMIIDKIMLLGVFDYTLPKLVLFALALCYFAKPIYKPSVDSCYVFSNVTLN